MEFFNMIHLMIETGIIQRAKVWLCTRYPIEQRYAITWQLGRWRCACFDAQRAHMAAPLPSCPHSRLCKSPSRPSRRDILLIMCVNNVKTLDNDTIWQQDYTLLRNFDSSTKWTLLTEMPLQWVEFILGLNFQSSEKCPNWKQDTIRVAVARSRNQYTVM